MIDVGDVRKALQPTAATAAALLIALLLGILVLAQRSGRHSSLRQFLLIGPPDAGKSAFFSLCRYGSRRPTVTSIASNAAILSAHGPIAAAIDNMPTGCSELLLTDLPGNPRLQMLVSDRFAQRKPIEGVLFFVDSTAVTAQSADVATALVDTLLRCHRRRVPRVLVCFNKTDVVTAVSFGRARRLVEAAVDALLEQKLSSSATLRKASTDDAADAALGDELADPETLSWLRPLSNFKFEDVDGVSVVAASGDSGSFSACSKWLQWMFK